ncbi:hypothetical protein TNCV_4022821 [Trichonephila clavipes]|nr:hypothetical protein TNCV_4022821 [Trichonephila clavipes]
MAAERQKPDQAVEVYPQKVMSSSWMKAGNGLGYLQRENTLWEVRASQLSLLSTNLTRGLAARRIFKVPPCREGTIHLQTSLSSPGFKQSPNGTAVSVPNHYTGWAITLNMFRPKVLPLVDWRVSAPAQMSAPSFH